MSTDVAVIGAGIVGASIAWNLARMGAGRISLYDAGTVAAGASGRTGALLRRHYSNRPEAALAQRGYEIFREWSEVVGGDCGFVPAGLIVTVPTGPGHGQNRLSLSRNIAMQNELGIDASLIDGRQLRELQPGVSVADDEIMAFEPTSGYVDAIAATRGMADAAIRAGVELHEHSAVQRIVVDANRVTGIETAAGAVSCGTVICAAGPWSPSLVATAGLGLPVTALRVQIAIVQRPQTFAPHLVFVDTAAGMFTRPWSPGTSLIGVGGGDQHDPVDPDRYELRNDPDYPARAISTAARRLPAMAAARYLHGHAGLYDMTPDAHPILGRTSVDGLFVAAGFSGAGFKKGPAVGECLAELVINGCTSRMDLSPFSLDRFASDHWRRPWSDTEYLFDSDFGHGL